MNTKQIGDRLENFVLTCLLKFDSTLHRTIASGAKSEKSDISGQFWRMELKSRNTKDISVKQKVWNKLCSEIPVGKNQVPLYIIENASKEKFVVMNFADFIRYMEKIYGKTKEK